MSTNFMAHKLACQPLPFVVAVRGFVEHIAGEWLTLHISTESERLIAHSLLFGSYFDFRVVE